MKIFAAFTKFEKRDDGTLMVCGVASSEAVDSDGEIVKADAMREALPDFMSLGTGALRSMHQPIAAGTVQKAEVCEDGKTYIEAEVVDPVEVLKVEKGVYKGFSIGGRVQKKEGKVIHKIRLNEISLVDRGANPEALLSLMKLESAEEEETVEKGMANVANLAYTLKQLSWLTCDQIDEASREGDGSPIPAKLRAWLAAGAAILVEMTQEEAAELLAALPATEPVDDPMAMSEPAGDLEKKGARHSAADLDHLQAIHDHAANMGACCAAEKVAKADGITVQVEVTEIPEFKEALAKLSTENETLQKRVKELEALPEMAKGVAVVLDADKQAEMFHKQAVDAKAADLEKYQSLTNPQDRYLASLKFIHKHGHKPE